MRDGGTAEQSFNSLHLLLIDYGTARAVVQQLTLTINRLQHCGTAGAVVQQLTLIINRLRHCDTAGRVVSCRLKWAGYSAIAPAHVKFGV